VLAEAVIAMARPRTTSNGDKTTPITAAPKSTVPTSASRCAAVTIILRAVPAEQNPMDQDRSDQEPGRCDRQTDRRQVNVLLELMQLREAVLERQGEQEARQQVEARLHHSQLLQQVAPVAVESLHRALAALVSVPPGVLLRMSRLVLTVAHQFQMLAIRPDARVRTARSMFGHYVSLMTNKSSSQDAGTMPSSVTSPVGFFDRFASAASNFASRAPFFAGCVLLIVVWAPSIGLFNLDTWQLIINTATTIITFLLVALLQNSQSRNDQAIQHKLNALADGLADLMAHISRRDENADLDRDLRELRLAVGLEKRETTNHEEGDAS
jgi:hypothetical protein